MYKNYDITIVAGESSHVASLIGVFAMNRSVINEFDGYPIFTDADTTWFIAKVGNKVVGFAALKIKKDTALFAYAYVDKKHRKNGLYQHLFKERVKWVKENHVKLIRSDCTPASLPVFLKNGFTITKKFKGGWTKVEKEL